MQGQSYMQWVQGLLMSVIFSSLLAATAECKLQYVEVEGSSGMGRDSGSDWDRHRNKWHTIISSPYQLNKQVEQ